MPAASKHEAQVFLLLLSLWASWNAIVLAEAWVFGTLDRPLMGHTQYIESHAGEFCTGQEELFLRIITQLKELNQQARDFSLWKSTSMLQILFWFVDTTKNGNLHTGTRDIYYRMERRCSSVPWITGILRIMSDVCISLGRACRGVGLWWLVGKDAASLCPLCTTAQFSFCRFVFLFELQEHSFVLKGINWSVLSLFSAYVAALMSSFLGSQLNIENVVAKGEIPRLHEFIQYLTECMHKQCPGSLVIW